MRVKYRCLMGAAVVAMIAGSSATAETLDQAIASAFATNPQLDIQRYETDVAREGLE